MKKAVKGHSLVTGFPSLYATSLIEALAAKGEQRVAVLCPHLFVPAAKIWSGQLRRLGTQLRIVEGEAHRVDFGLSGGEWKELRESVGTIYHFCPPGEDRARTRKEALEVLELVEEAPLLEGLVHLGLFSAGGRGGTRGGGKTARAASAAAAETTLLGRPGRAPVTILRCGVPVSLNPTLLTGMRGGGIERALQVLILLCVQGDGAALGKLEGRFVPLTPAETLAQTALSAGGAAGRRVRVLDVYDETSGEVGALRARIARAIEAHGGPKGKLSRLCRKEGQRLLGQWIPSTSPLALLHDFTAPLRRDAKGETAKGERVEMPPLDGYLAASVEALTRNIEETVRTLVVEKEVIDNLE